MTSHEDVCSDLVNLVPVDNEAASVDALKVGDLHELGVVVKVDVGSGDEGGCVGDAQVGSNAHARLRNNKSY